MPETTAKPSFLKQLASDPAIQNLGKTAGKWAVAKAEDIGKDKLKAQSAADDGSGGVIEAGKREAKRQAAIPAIKGFFKGAWKGLFKRKGATKRPTNIVETTVVGAPIDIVWDAWTQYEEFPGYMKGPVSVKVDQEEQDGEQKKTLNWQAKIFWSKRNWKSTIQEEVEHERIRWTSEAAKGVVDGAVTFTPMGENLTHIQLVLEYRPKGLFERTGNLWRAQGRRTRLDFKHFTRHVVMNDQTEDQDQEQPPDERDEQGAVGPGDQPEGTEPEQGAEPGAEPEPGEAPEDGEPSETGEAGEAPEGREGGDAEEGEREPEPVS